MTEVALGIDIGTGSTKAGLVDGDGRLLAVGRSAHLVAEPRPGWSECDPASWLRSAAAAIADVVAARPDASIVAVGFSGQMHGVVLCDEALEPVRPAVLWSDRRSQPYLDELRGRFDDADLVALANPVVAGMAGSTIAALVRDEPDAVRRTATILQPKDWVRHRLTGTVATDPSDASATLLWDVPADRWSDSACRIFGVDRELLAPVRGSEDSAGVVTVGGGATFGLTPGLPVAIGGADTACALRGAGVGPGRYQVSTGTGGQIAVPVDSVSAADPSAGIHLFRSVEADGPRWYAMAAIQNAGVAVDWALGVLGIGLDDMARLMAETPVGSNGVVFLPYLTGERTPHLDAGLSGGWSGLRPGTTRAELARSVFEGVAFALRDGLDALTGSVIAGPTPDPDLKPATGPNPDAVLGRPGSALLAGGGSTARWWQQLLADGLGLPLVPHDAVDASVRGAGLLAWASVGHSIDSGPAVNHLPAIEPDDAATADYEEALNRFRVTSAAVRNA